jgi:hypothetical protein
MKHIIPLAIILAIVAAVGCTTYRAPRGSLIGKSGIGDPRPSAPLNIPGAKP